MGCTTKIPGIYLCGAECESVVHVLWECTAYSRASFTEKLREPLGDSYADFVVM